jgi:glycosyltransferase involved in cell wall biosynthesis
MGILYISQDGAKPSGITTYGCHTLVARAGAEMLLLNADRPPPAAPPEIHARIHCVPESESHDVQAVARHLGVLAAAMPGGVAILPNTGDTPWNATVEWLRGLPAVERARFRVLGIVHSDVETQYAGAVRHATFAAAWVGVSRRCAAELQKRLVRRVPAAAIHELPYPMPVPSRAAASNTADPLRLVYAGRLEEPQKRISRLAAVLNTLAGREVEFSATIVGDGPARAEFTAAIECGPAATRVRLTGALDHAALAAVLETSDVFLLTSAYEGLPLALLEAMAAGVYPIVMQIESGLEDVVTTGGNAIVVPQGDTAAMAEAVAQLSRDRAQLERLKRAARETIRARFSPERHFARLDEILASSRAAPPPDPATVAPDPTAAAVQRLVERARATARPVVIYGAGMFGRKVVDACEAAGVTVAGLIDSDPSRWGQSYCGLVCAAPDALTRWSDAVFLAGSMEFADEIAQRIASAFSQRGLPAPIVITCLE